MWNKGVTVVLGDMDVTLVVNPYRIGHGRPPVHSAWLRWPTLVTQFWWATRGLPLTQWTTSTECIGHREMGMTCREDKRGIGRLYNILARPGRAARTRNLTVCSFYDNHPVFAVRYLNENTTRLKIRVWSTRLSLEKGCSITGNKNIITMQVDRSWKHVTAPLPVFREPRDIDWRRFRPLGALLSPVSPPGARLSTGLACRFGRRESARIR